VKLPDYIDGVDPATIAKVMTQMAWHFIDNVVREDKEMGYNPNLYLVEAAKHLRAAHDCLADKEVRL
jgi:hypothetical protein